MIAFLASDKSSYITGTAIEVAGQLFYFNTYTDNIFVSPQVGYGNRIIYNLKSHSLYINNTLEI